jgi:uncharacterized protein (DUF1778 family)
MTLDEKLAEIGPVRIKLVEERFQELLKELEAPVRDLPRMKRLLTEPGVFDS